MSWRHFLRICTSADNASLVCLRRAWRLVSCISTTTRVTSFATFEIASLRSSVLFSNLKQAWYMAWNEYENIQRSNNMIIFFSSMLPNVEACVAERLTPRTAHLEDRISSLARRVYSLDKELDSTLSLLTEVYKRVTATYWWGITQRWTSILSRGE